MGMAVGIGWYECMWGFAPDCEGVAFAEDEIQPEGWISYTCRACQEWGSKSGKDAPAEMIPGHG